MIYDSTKQNNGALVNYIYFYFLLESSKKTKKINKDKFSKEDKMIRTVKDFSNFYKINSQNNMKK